jgi:hypothetical protein
MWRASYSICINIATSVQRHLASLRHGIYDARFPEWARLHAAQELTPAGPPEHHTSSFTDLCSIWLKFSRERRVMVLKIEKRCQSSMWWFKISGTDLTPCFVMITQARGTVHRQFDDSFSKIFIIQKGALEKKYKANLNHGVNWGSLHNKA